MVVACRVQIPAIPVLNSFLYWTYALLPLIPVVKVIALYDTSARES